MSPLTIVVLAVCGIGAALGGLVSPHGYGGGYYSPSYYPSVYKAPAYSYANVYKVNHKPIPIVYSKPVVYKTVVPAAYPEYYPHLGYHGYSGLHGLSGYHGLTHHLPYYHH